MDRPSYYDMRPRTAFRRAIRTVALAAALLQGATVAAFAQEASILPSPLVSDPAKIDLPALRSAREVTVYADETRTTPARIEKAAIDGSYARFFSVLVPAERTGVVRVATRPDQVEAGSYDLRIWADGHQLVVPVLATLEQEETIIQRDAEMLGESEEAVRLRYGLSKTLWNEKLEITLPESYTEGAVLVLELDEHPDRWFTWLVDGYAVLEGHGENVLRLPLDEAGPMKLAVEVRDGGAVVAGWEGAIRVDPEPPLGLQRGAGQPFRLSAPEGFGAYEWRVGDEVVGKERTPTFRFPRPGSYRVECRATDVLDPEAGATRLFRRITWNVEVK